ncbi:MAG: MMPL family transporter [Parvularculaceae bacterium]
MPLFTKFLLGWTDLSRRAGWVVVISFLAAGLLAGWFAATHLKVNTDTSAMLDQSLPSQIRSHALQAAFPQIKNDIIVVAKAPTMDEADAFARKLRSRALAKPDIFAGVFSPEVDPFFEKNGLLYLSTEELTTRLAQMSKASSLIETLVKAPTIGQFFAALADNDALAERSDLGRETLANIYAELTKVVEASKEGKTRPFAWTDAIAGDDAPSGGYQRLIFIAPRLDYSRLQPAKPAITELKSEITAIEAEMGGRANAVLTGDPALRADELSSVANGIEISFLISFIAVGILLLLCYRSISYALITLVGLVLSIIFTGAFAAMAIGELNLVSVAFTVLLVGLGIDYAIHLLLHVQEHRRNGDALGSAIKNAMQEVGPGLVLASITTTLGFFAFIPTEFRGIAQLGIIAGMGVIIALIVTLSFLPAALSVITRNKGASDRHLDPLPARKANPAIANSIALVTVLLGAVALLALPKARFDANPMSLRNPKAPSVIGFNDLFANPETVPYRLTLLESNETAAREAAARAKKIETVKGTRTLLNFVPADVDEKLDLISFGAGSLAFALDAPENLSTAPSATDGARKLIDRLNSAYETGSPARKLSDALSTIVDDQNGLERLQQNIFEYWPALVERLKLQLQAEPVTLNDLPPALTARYRSESGEWRVDIVPKEDVRDPKKLTQFVNSIEAVFPEVTGGAITTEKAGRVIAKSMLEASSLALAAIAVFLLILLRRIDDVILMLFPLGLAAVLTTAAGVIFNIPFNYANVIVLPLLMGIGVDSGIHYVLHRRQVETGISGNDRSTPRAIFFAALTTIASFGSRTLSKHRGTASMGELLSIAIGFTLICTLIVLPVAFRLVKRRLEEG